MKNQLCFDRIFATGITCQYGSKIVGIIAGILGYYYPAGIIPKRQNLELLCWLKIRLTL